LKIVHVLPEDPRGARFSITDSKNVFENSTRFSEPVFEFRTDAVRSRSLHRAIWVWWSKIEHQTRKVCSKMGHGFRKIIDLEAPSDLFQKVCSKTVHAFQDRVRESSTSARSVVEKLTPESHTLVKLLSLSRLFPNVCSNFVHLSPLAWSNCCQSQTPYGKVLENSTQFPRTCSGHKVDHVTETCGWIHTPNSLTDRSDRLSGEPLSGRSVISSDGSLGGPFDCRKTLGSAWMAYWVSQSTACARKRSNQSEWPSIRAMLASWNTYPGNAALAEFLIMLS